MNWKNVRLLLTVDMKTYRLVGGKRFRRFRENTLVTYILYIGACVLGSLVGWLVGSFYAEIMDSQLKEIVLQGFISFLIAVPTITLLYGVVLTQMSQFQRIGSKVFVQPLYWFPITWEEHTLASILANILGTPLIVTVVIVSAITVVAMFMNLISLALLTTLAVCVSVFMASATTKISKILQVRVSGAITKVAGKAAIWVRLVVSLLFFIIFYTVYFVLYSQTNPFLLLEMISSGQKTLWFIPYVWPGITLSYLASGRVLEVVIFSVASLAFLGMLFLVATRLNIKYGLYEMPTIKLSSGIHVSREGVLGRLGFSAVEAALLRKDFKAFTRRMELAYIYIFPVIFTIMPLLTSIGSVARYGSEAPPPAVLHSFLFAWLSVMPGTLLAAMLGSMMIGVEGEPVWYIHSSPITARSLMKAKYSFVLLFALAVTLLCSVIAGYVWAPSANLAMLGSVEAVFLVFSLSMVSLSFGVRGADFREMPRPRMIQPLWSIINGVVCIILAVVIVSPVIPYILNFFFETAQVPLTIALPISAYYLYLAVPISGIIAFIVTYTFYRIALNNVEQFLANAERYK